MTDWAWCKEGMNQIWNNDFDGADSRFVGKSKTDPRCALYYSESAFVKSWLTQDYEMAFKRLENSRDVSQRVLDSFKQDGYASLRRLSGSSTKSQGPPPTEKEKAENALIALDARVCLAESLFFLAIMLSLRGSKVKAVYTLRKSWKAMEQSQKDSKSVDGVDSELLFTIKYGIGVFYFVLGLIPKRFLSVIQMAGFKADKATGLQYCEEVYDQGSLRSQLAGMTLLVNNLLVPRGLSDITEQLNKAEVICKAMIEKSPNSSVVYLMNSHLERKRCQVDEGVQMMEKSLQAADSFKNDANFIKYELANCYCMRLEWNKAVEFFMPLTSLKTFHLRAFSHLQLAGCYFMMGESAKGMAILDQVPSAAQKSSYDQLVCKVARRYKSNGGAFCALELMYIRRDLPKMLKYADTILAAIEKCALTTKANEQVDVKKLKAAKPSKMASMKAKLTNPDALPSDHHADDCAAYWLLKGSVLKEQKKYVEAAEGLRTVIDLKEVVTQKFYLAYCHYELGEALYGQGKLDEASEMMRACSSYSGYDFEDPLKSRLRVTMDQINAERKAKGLGEVELEENEPAVEVDESDKDL
eukprot:Lithocolla_globosa_v1_NODE_1686_length_2397_cov_19.598294.p1 type:complete len:583 gc:universal NODE_1686_length_2397_cov_19.598294:320-2068(+)